MNLRWTSSAITGGGLAAQVLGGSRIGLAGGEEACAWPVQHVIARVLGDGGSGVLHEAWQVDGTVQQGAGEGIAWRRCGDLLFGVIEADEPDEVPAPDGHALQWVSRQIYARLFRLLDAQGLPHLWRVWNYMADINGESGGLERYRQFNAGRAQAFEQAARSVVGRVPAACALGVAGGPLSVAFLAGATPLVTIENPRQVSAFHYPDIYGPRSPTFSRAALARLPGQELFFLSGTASIVGHRSVHIGDVVAQTGEAMRNVEAVLAEARSLASGPAPALSALNYRVYIRHAGDLDAVRTALRRWIGEAPLACVQADVCRSDLLMEIEAFGLQDA